MCNGDCYDSGLYFIASYTTNGLIAHPGNRKFDLLKPGNLVVIKPNMSAIAQARGHTLLKIHT